MRSLGELPPKLTRRAAQDLGRPARFFQQLAGLVRRHVATQSERVRLRKILRECRKELLPELDWWIAENAKGRPQHRPRRETLDLEITILIDALRLRGWVVAEASLAIARRFDRIWTAARPTGAEGAALWEMQTRRGRISAEERVERLAQQFQKRYFRRKRRQQGPKSHPSSA